MNPAGAGIGETVAAGLWLCAFTLAFRGYGAALLRKTGFVLHGKAGRTLEAVFSVALGLYLLSLWSLAWGWAGALTKPVFWLFLAGGWILEAWSRKTALPRGLSIGLFWKEAAWVDRLLTAAFASLAVSTFIGACAPETGNDALAYHLYFPKLYAASGKLLSDIPHPRALWPGMMGMIYTAGLVLHGAILAKLFSWLTALLAVASVPAAAACFLGKNAARAAAFFAIFTPTLWMQSLYAYSDNAIALYAFLAFVSLWAWSRGERKIRFLVIPALFLSALLSLKFYTLTHAAVLAFFAAWAIGSAAGVKTALKAFMILSAACFVLAGFWYARSWVLTGNPVFPFFPEWFGGRGFEQTMVGRIGVPKTLFSFAALPWNLAIRPDLFGGEPFGALFAMALPLAFFYGGRCASFARAALIAAFFYALIWFFNIQLARFLMPAIPPAALGLGAVCSEWLKRPKPLTRAVLGAVFAAAFLQFGLAHYYAFKMAPPTLGFETPDSYLRREERSYAFMQTLHKLPADEKMLVVNESRLYYAPVGTVLYGPLADLEMRRQKLSFREWLKRRGITSVLVASREETALSPALYLRGDQAVVVEPAPVAGGSSLDPDDPMHYALWRLARR